MQVRALVMDGRMPGVGFLELATEDPSHKSLATWFEDCMETRPKAIARTRLDDARDFANHVPAWLPTSRSTRSPSATCAGG
jgi:hypothetical protein